MSHTCALQNFIVTSRDTLDNFFSRTFQNFRHDMTRTISPDPHRQASPRSLSRVIPSVIGVTGTSLGAIYRYVKEIKHLCADWFYTFMCFFLFTFFLCTACTISIIIIIIIIASHDGIVRWEMGGSIWLTGPVEGAAPTYKAGQGAPTGGTYSCARGS